MRRIAQSREHLDTRRTSARRIGGSVACLLVLFGCNTTAPVVDASLQSSAAEPKRYFKGCIEAIASKPEYVPLAGKLHLHPNVPYPRTYLSNSSRPDKSEIELLNAMHGDLQECRTIALDDALLHPNARKVLVDSYVADYKIWTEVLAGQLTWGKFRRSGRSCARRPPPCLHSARSRFLLR
jgi:hypothetical protein